MRGNEKKSSNQMWLNRASSCHSVVAESRGTWAFTRP